VGVGCMVDSCMDCRYCKRNDEQFCATGSTFTYGGVSTYGRCGPAGKPTIGGYRCVAGWSISLALSPVPSPVSVAHLAATAPRPLHTTAQVSGTANNAPENLRLS
jgi:D-arabinose 1-dehydrogenase-like Zn-dependent alcohol dehydrogenase